MEDRSLSRLHYVDALRAFAMVLIIPWHAANFFAIRGQGGAPLAGVIWISHAFRMPLFFLIAGFFGTLVVERRGSLDWLRGRLVRLGIPLVLGVLVLAPLAGLLATWQPDGHGGISPLVGLTHPKPTYLWFLWYLLIVVFAWLGAWAVAKRVAPGLAVGRLLHAFSHSGWLLVGLAVPCALALWSTGDWAAVPDNHFSAPAGLLAYYAIFFAAGWLLGGRISSLEPLGRNPYRRLGVALIVAVPAFWLFIHSGDPGIANNSAIRLGALYLGALCGWFLIAFLVGFFHRHLSGERPSVRYVADASYWIYLSHMLFLAPMQLLLIGLLVPSAAQFTLAVAVTFAMTLITYELFVRYSAIGRVLHGPRHRPSARRRRIGFGRKSGGGWREMPVTPPAAAVERRA